MRISDWSSDVCSSDLLEGEAAIFVDGRYTLQVRDQVDGRFWQYEQVPQTSVAEWLKSHAPDGARIGYDPWLHTRSWVKAAREALESRNGELVALPDNPVDAVWRDRHQPANARQIGRASCREECVSTCRSGGSRYH